MKKGIVILLAVLVCLTGCSKYSSVVVDKYSKGVTYELNDVRYKQISNYRLVKLKELSVSEDSVILKHDFKCDILYFIGGRRFHNMLETDTICLYKNASGEFEFHD